MTAIFCRLRWLRALCVTAALASLPGSARAQALGDTLAQDLEQTIECRKLLFEDPILGPLNLGVRVKDRVAVLWGPVPSMEAGKRAEQCLRTFIELMEVRNEMHLAPDYDWRPVAPAMPPMLPDKLPPALPEPIQLAPPRLGLPFLAGITVECGQATTILTPSSPSCPTSPSSASSG